MTIDSPSDSGEIDGGLVTAFVGLADALFAVDRDAGVVGVVERVIDAAQSIVPGADVVSAVLRGPDGRLDTVAERRGHVRRELAGHLVGLAPDDRLAELAEPELTARSPERECPPRSRRPVPPRPAPSTATRRAAPSGDAMLPASGRARPPAAAISSTTAAAWSGSTSFTTTAAPSAARAWA